MTCSDSSSSDSWQRERKLLHWVNSLPPPACLLVEAPVDLRFGDVLLAIVHWLQAQRQRGGLENSLQEEQALWQSIGDGGGDDDGNGALRGCSSSSTVIERLRFVLRFVAREARSEDGDAMFVVNEAQCAERLKSGAIDAVCAVLRILKRVSDQQSALLEMRQQQQQRYAGTREQQLQQHSIIANELLRLSKLREDANPRSSCAKIRHKRNLRIVGLSSDRVCNGAGRVPCSQPPAPAQPMRRSDAVLKETANPHKSAIIATTPAGLKNQSVLRKPKTTKSKQRAAESFQERKVPMFRDANGQLHVYSMIDPSSHQHTRVPRPPVAIVSRPPVDTANKSPAMDSKTFIKRSPVAHRVCEWMDSLGVTPPGGKVREAFEDGVILSQIAAGIVKKYGDIAEKCRLDTFTELSGEVVVIPQGVTLSPQNAAQKRTNVAIAVEILTKYCGFGCISNREKACAKLVAFFASTKTYNKGSQRESATTDSVWELLDHIRAGVEASRVQVTLSQLKLDPKDDKTPETESITNCGADENSKRDANVDPENAPPPPHCEKRRPYITNEQMQAVNRWLKSIDKGMLEITGKSLLQDPFRNGVLFCLLCPYASNVYTRAFANQNDSPLRFARAPKTLMEVRQNLAKVFKRVSRLENFRLPSYYLSSSTWEAIIMGDQQITCGVLWCLWQYAQELENRNRKEEPLASVLCDERHQQQQETELRELAVTPLLSSKPDKKTTVETTKPKKKKKTPSKVCPLLIDIPAVVLASEWSRDKDMSLGFDCQSPFSLLGVHTLWEDDHPSDHDLYPQPSLALVFTASIEVEPELPVASQREVITAATVDEDIVEGNSTLSTILDSSQDASQVMEDAVPHPQPVDTSSALEDTVISQEEVSSYPQSDPPHAEAARWKGKSLYHCTRLKLVLTQTFPFFRGPEVSNRAN